MGALRTAGARVHPAIQRGHRQIRVDQVDPQALTGSKGLQSWDLH